MQYISQSAYSRILGLFLCSRIILFLITYVGYILLTAPKYSSLRVPFSVLLNVWNRWDASNYIRYAQVGYPTIYDYAFFPFYPLSIHLIAQFTGNYLLVAMLLSNLATLVALIIIYFLAVDIAGEHIRYRSIFYLCIFPTAFFLFAAYNESFFLVFSAGAILAMRRRVWLVAGLLGAFASATRPAGLLLVLPYLCEWWLARDKEAGFLSVRRFLQLVPICLVPVGILLYSIYCWRVTGNPLAFAAAQVRWGRQTTLPWEGIVLSFRQLLFVQPFGSFFQIHILLDLSATLGFILLTALGWRRVPLSYTLWSASGLLLVLLSSSPAGDSLASNQRIVLELFPGFITLALLGKQRAWLHQAILLFFPSLLAVLSLVFIMNRWMV
jgi:hypothetical protein